jgi:hypothetical protein
MANTMKKTNTETTVDNTEENVETSVVEEVKETVVETKKEPRKFEATDGIPCKSITSGGLYMEGIKSHITYEWADNGDVTEVEYQDIVAAIRSNVSYISKPYFIIEDKDIIAQFPQLNKIYASMYSFKDLRDVLVDLPPSNMKSTILALPDGAKESIKSIASKMISIGTLDSVQKIKILDEIFDTELMLMTGLFN